MSKRPLLLGSFLVTAALSVAGCGVSLAAGGSNAATHPASGIFTSNTVGGALDVSSKEPLLSYRSPSNKPPATPPPGQSATVKAVEAAVSGGCWQDSGQGDYYHAYDQVFWWQGDCGDAVAGVTMELFASAAQAKAEERHPSSMSLLGRFIDGAVLVNVWSNAPGPVANEVGAVKGMQPVAGYGG